MALVPEGALMQRAAAGLASVCATVLRASPDGMYGSRVAVLAGTGDNGGDALYAAAMLARRGAVVTAIQAGPRMHAGGAAALRAAGGRFAVVARSRAAEANGWDNDETRPDVLTPYDAGHDVRRAIGRADL